MLKKIILIFALATVLIMAGCAAEEFVKEEGEEITKQGHTIKVINNNLETPWGLDFIQENKIIVTEKTGQIKIINEETNEVSLLSGVPSVDSSGQGGLLDVLLDEEYIYITYVTGTREGTGTHLGRGVLNLDEKSIDDFVVLYNAEPFIQSSAHFGSRILIKDEFVYLTLGDRGRKNFGPEHISQNTLNPNGAIIRLYKDGSIPQTNPFINNDDVLDEIYTYGHRNVQGITLQKETGRIWISEHGERDGDEINILEEGGNYGWPLAHYGCRYGTNIPVGDLPHENPDTINPVYYWECGSGGFPPAGMTFYSGKKFSEWEGNLFVGNLAGRYLGSFQVDNDDVQELEPLLRDEGWRIRDVKESPEGYLYVITDANPGMLLKIMPENS